MSLMKFSFDEFREMILVFSDGYLVDTNEATQRKFNSYGFSLLGKPLGLFLSEGEIKRLKKLSIGNEEKVNLKFPDGTVGEFAAKYYEDENENLFLVLKEAAESESDWVAGKRKIYDPLLMGKAEIYKQEISRRAEFLLEQIKELECSALIRKNDELISRVKAIKNAVCVMEYHDGRAITDMADPVGGFTAEVCAFNISRLAEVISEKARGYLMLENYNVSVNFSSSRPCAVYGDYMEIGRALSVFIVLAVKNVNASGRKGRINNSVRQSGKRIKILIADNGIGLSGCTFERIKNDGIIPSGLECFRELEGTVLADAVRWIENADGEVYISNNTQKGTVVVIYLPLCSDNYVRAEHLLKDIELLEIYIENQLKEEL